MSTDDYTITVNVERNIFPYKECITENVLLKRHYELPANLSYSHPLISSNGQLIAVKAKSRSTQLNDYVFVWKVSNPYKPLYSFNIPHRISCYDISPNSRSLIIVYHTHSPIHYSLESGNKIVELEQINEEGNIIQDISSVCCSFSPKGKYFALTTTSTFTVWNTLKGEFIKNIFDNSPFKYLRGDLLVFISKECVVKIVKFINGQLVSSFKLNQVNNSDDIITTAISPDFKYFYYVTSKAIMTCNIQTKAINTVLNFNNEHVLKCIINGECTHAITSNLNEVVYWKIDQGRIEKYYKEYFTSFSIDFEHNYLITVNDVCLSKSTFYSQQEENYYIWLNKNPSKFERFSFSPDFTVLLTIVDDNNAILYNTQTGQIIKKLYGNNYNWSLSCIMAPDTSKTAIVVSKLTHEQFKIWNYANGKEVMTITGYNVHSFSFSPSGDFLVGGCVEGEEIGRIWNLQTKKYKSLFNKEGNNKNTFVHHTLINPFKIICVSEQQHPIVFDVDGEVQYKCEDIGIVFKKVFEIKSSKDNYFYVKGSTENDNVAMLYNLKDGKVVKEYKNCVNIDISQNSKYLLTKSDNENGGKLTISNIDNNNMIRSISCDISPIYSCFLQDSQAIVSPFGIPKKMKFILTNPTNGKCLGNVEFSKKTNTYSECDLSCNLDDNSLRLRYIQIENFD